MSAPSCSEPFTAILTRPRGQSAGLAAALRQHGIRTVEFPLIDIVGMSAVASVPAIEAVDRALHDIERFALVFFVSPNAIEQAFARAAAIGEPLAQRLARRPGSPPPIIAVVGPGSAQALQQHGVTPETHCVLAPQGALIDNSTGDPLAPSITEKTAEQTAERAAQRAAIRYDSEALLLSLDREHGRETLSGKSVLVVRGDGGRELFAEALREAGAAVHVVTAYQRVVPRPDEAAWLAVERLLAAWGPVDAPAEIAPAAPFCWVLSSSEGVRNLRLLAERRYSAGRPGAEDDDNEVPDPRYMALLRAPVIVPHPRIAAAAGDAGFGTITNAGAGDANLVRVILAASERNGTHPA